MTTRYSNVCHEGFHLRGPRSTPRLVSILVLLLVAFVGLAPVPARAAQNLPALPAQSRLTHRLPMHGANVPPGLGDALRQKGLLAAKDQPLTEQKLQGDGAVPGEFVGYSVALNASGDVALVGAPAFDVSFNPGVAYVFQKRGGSWTQQQELHGSGGPTFDQFGYSVALNASGNVALVGAPDSFFGVHPGAAFVFEERGGSWTQQQELHASDSAPGDNFGFSAALSASGNAAIVGAFQYGYVGGSRPGAAYVFQQHGAGWAQQQKLQSGDGDLDDEFGISVALSASGNAAIVGADGKDEYAGRAFVFQERGGSWTQQQELHANNGVTFDGFGGSVALNSSGNVALIGAGGRDGVGAAFVFERRGGNWTPQQELRASDSIDFICFGCSVALNAKGNVALVGAAYKDGDTGAAYTFQERGGSWTQQQELRASDGTSGDDFGWSVALNSSGNVALVGAPGLFNSGTNPGAAYVYNGK